MDIKEILRNYQIGKDNTFTSERSELVSKFVSRLNSSRKENGFKELGAKFYAIKMAEAGLKSNEDLYWFYAYCNDAKNFSACWWWSLKSK